MTDRSRPVTGCEACPLPWTARDAAQRCRAARCAIGWDTLHGAALLRVAETLEHAAADAERPGPWLLVLLCDGEEPVTIGIFDGRPNLERTGARAHAELIGHAGAEVRLLDANAAPAVVWRCGDSGRLERTANEP